MAAAVNMGFKSHSLLRNLSLGCQTENLIATAVGENWLVPAIEFMETTSIFKHICAGSKVEMVSIS